MSRLALPLLVLALSGAGLWAAYDRGWPLAQRAETSIQPVYDRNTAFILAGQEVPPGIDTHYLFNLDPQTPERKAAESLLKGLERGQREGQYVAIIGPDPQYNRAVLEATAARSDRDYPQLTLIYVGPQRQRDAIESVAAPLAGSFDYVVYP